MSGAIAHGRSILAALAAGADLAYVGSAFIATEEANADERYKQMVVDSTAADIVHSDHFTGVHGNYLRGSIIAAGLDPDRLTGSDASQMDFGSTGPDTGLTSNKAWRDIWGCGQGIGGVDKIERVADLVGRPGREFAVAEQSLPRWDVQRSSATTSVPTRAELCTND